MCTVYIPSYLSFPFTLCTLPRSHGVIRSTQDGSVPRRGLFWPAVAPGGDDKGPDAAGFFISLTAFLANPHGYFKILVHIFSVLKYIYYSLVKNKLKNEHLRMQGVLHNAGGTEVAPSFAA
jgi:hypothetical protein